MTVALAAIIYLIIGFLLAGLEEEPFLLLFWPLIVAIRLTSRLGKGEIRK